MDETLMQESTQPEVDTAEETVAEDVVEADTDAEVATPAEETEDTAPEAADSAADVEEPEQPKQTVRVKFNKQEREYSIEDAAPLVEKGLKWDSFKENHEKLKFLAAASDKTVGELIEALIVSSDNALRQSILDECGGNEAVADKLFNLQKADRQRKFDEFKVKEAEQSKLDAEEEQKQLSNRLASDFLELCKEIPDKFEKFTDIPDTVVQTAISKHISLTDSYLRYERAQAKKTEAVKVKQAEAAKKSTGSLSGNQANPEPDIEDFSKAFNQALR